MDLLPDRSQQKIDKTLKTQRCQYTFNELLVERIPSPGPSTTFATAQCLLGGLDARVMKSLRYFLHVYHFRS